MPTIDNIMDLQSYKKNLFLMLDDAQEKLRQKYHDQYRNARIKNINVEDKFIQETVDLGITVFR